MTKVPFFSKGPILYHPEIYKIKKPQNLHSVVDNLILN